LVGRSFGSHDCRPVVRCSGGGSAGDSAPVFVELSAIPIGDTQRVGKLLREMNITVDFDLGEGVRRSAVRSFAAYAVRRRRVGGGSSKPLLADFVIAPHALLQADRLMTRDARRYSLDLPSLRLV
jgi:predicted nucleic acid-binding protein